MGFDTEAAEKTLVDWVTSVTGRQTVIGFPNATRAGAAVDPAASLHISNIEPVGRAAIVLADDQGKDLDETVELHAVATVSLNLYRGSPLESLSDLDLSLYSSEWIEKLCDAGLGFNSRSLSRDLTQKQRAKWEKRVQTDLLFNVAYATTPATVGSIQSIDIINADTGQVIQVRNTP